MIRIVGALFLALGWALWLAARFAGQDWLSGWAFVVTYAGLALGLVLAASMANMGGTFGSFARLLGLGFLSLALGEVGWLSLYKDGEPGGNVILPNLPYYASSLLFAVSAAQLFLSGRDLLSFPMKWLWGALGVAVVLVAAMTALTFDPAQLSPGFWTDTTDNVVGAFASLVMIAIAFLTAGGDWSRWTLPLAAGLGLRMLGNIYYTLTASSYAYGSLADWLWLLGGAAIYFFLIREGDVAQQRVPAA